MKDLKNILSEVKKTNLTAKEVPIAEASDMTFSEFESAVEKLGAERTIKPGSSRWIGEDGWDIKAKDKKMHFFNKGDWQKKEIVVMYKGTKYLDSFKAAYDYIKREIK